MTYAHTTTMEVFHAIRKWDAINPLQGPSMADIAKELGFSCPSTVRRHRDRLAVYGLVTFTPGKPRSIKLTEKGRAFKVADRATLAGN